MQLSKEMGRLKAGQMSVAHRIACRPMIDKATHAQNRTRVELVGQLAGVNWLIRDQENRESFAASTVNVVEA